MGRSNVGRAKARPLRIVPAIGQVSEYVGESPNSEACDVFHKDELRLQIANEPKLLPPQSAALSVEPGAEARLADVLAGEAPDEEVDGRQRRRRRFGDVAVVGDPGPVAGEDGGAVGVGLAVPCAAASGGELDAKVEAADS